MRRWRPSCAGRTRQRRTQLVASLAASAYACCENERAKRIARDRSRSRPPCAGGASCPRQPIVAGLLRCALAGGCPPRHRCRLRVLQAAQKGETTTGCTVLRCVRWSGRPTPHSRRWSTGASGQRTCQRSPGQEASGTAVATSRFQASSCWVNSSGTKCRSSSCSRRLTLTLTLTL